MIRNKAKLLASIKRKLPVVDRPKTRGDCIDGVRPCPHVGCRHHMALELSISGETLMSPGQRNHHIETGLTSFEGWSDVLVEGLFSMKDTCSLDVADDVADSGDEMPWNDIADITCKSRERARLVEQDAFNYIRKFKAKEIT